MPRLRFAISLLLAASGSLAELGSGAVDEPAAGKAGANSPSAWETYLPSADMNYAKAWAGGDAAKYRDQGLNEATTRPLSAVDAKAMPHEGDVGRDSRKHVLSKEGDAAMHLDATGNEQDDKGTPSYMPFMDYMPGDQGDIKRLEAKLRDLQGQLQKSEDARSLAEADSKKLRAQLSEGEDARKQVEEARLQAEADSKRLRAQLRENQDARERMEQQMDDQRRELGEFRKTVLQKDARLQELEAEKSRLTSQSSLAAKRAQTEQAGPAAAHASHRAPLQTPVADQSSQKGQNAGGDGHNMGFQSFIPSFGFISSNADAGGRAAEVNPALAALGQASVVGVRAGDPTENVSLLPLLLAVVAGLALLLAGVALSGRVLRSRPGAEDAMGTPFLQSESGP